MLVEMVEYHTLRKALLPQSAWSILAKRQDRETLPEREEAHSAECREAFATCDFREGVQKYQLQASTYLLRIQGLDAGWSRNRNERVTTGLRDSTKHMWP